MSRVYLKESGKRLTKRGRLKRQRARRTVRHVTDKVSRAPAPRARLPKPFVILDDVIGRAFDALGAEHEDPGPFTGFQIAIFDRSFNNIKAVKVLLENGYREGAVGIARQLLELSMSMERIFRSDGNPESNAIRFIRFGLLQQVRYLRIRDRYLRKQGFDGIRDLPDFTGDEALVEQFGDFLARRRADGSLVWRESWCSKSARAMAQESAIETREAQYELLYRHGRNRSTQRRQL